MQQIYLNADDDITEVIGRLEHLSSERVALIPPKRSTALQSVVNLKLLKKAAQSQDNELVLITKDPVITKVAAELKLMTAPNLEAEPQVPEAEDAQPLPDDTIDANEHSERDYAAADDAASNVADGDDRSESTAKDTKPKAATKGKKVPDFNRFKKRIFWIVLVVLLLAVGLWWALFVAPRAEVSIDGLTQAASSDFDFRADPDLERSDFDNRQLRAEIEQESRTLSTNFDATGSETVGERATGEVTIVNCETDSITISSGTELTAANGLVYSAQESVTISPSDRNPPFNVEDCEEDETATVPVQAEEIGEDYNIGPSDYTVDGFDSDAVYSTGSSSMSGGEEEEVTVVSSEDIENTQDALLEEERDSVQTELEGRFGDDLVVIDASLTEDIQQISADPEEGEEADRAELVIEANYTLRAVDRTDMEELLLRQYRDTDTDDNDDEVEQLGLIESGLDDAEFSARDNENEFGVSAEGILGPDIDEDELKEDLGGEEYREAINIVEGIPNVRNVQIELRPIWANLRGRVPSNPDKITIDFEIDIEDGVDNGDDSGD